MITYTDAFTRADGPVGNDPRGIPYDVYGTDWEVVSHGLVAPVTGGLLTMNTGGSEGSVSVYCDGPDTYTAHYVDYLGADQYYEDTNYINGSIVARVQDSVEGIDDLSNGFGPGGKAAILTWLEHPWIGDHLPTIEFTLILPRVGSDPNGISTSMLMIDFGTGYYRRKPWTIKLSFVGNLYTCEVTSHNTNDPTTTHTMFAYADTTNYGLEETRHGLAYSDRSSYNGPTNFDDLVLTKTDIGVGHIKVTPLQIGESHPEIGPPRTIKVTPRDIRGPQTRPVVPGDLTVRQFRIWPDDDPAALVTDAFRRPLFDPIANIFSTSHPLGANPTPDCLYGGASVGDWLSAPVGWNTEATVVQVDHEGSFSPVESDFVIVDSQLSINPTGDAHALIECGVSDQEVRATIVSQTGRIDLMVRADGPDNWYLVQVSPGGQMDFWYRQFGGFGHVATLPQSCPLGHEAGISAHGDKIKILLDGVVVKVFTDNNLTVGTKAGIRQDGSGPVGLRNFRVLDPARSITTFGDRTIHDADALHVGSSPVEAVFMGEVQVW